MVIEVIRNITISGKTPSMIRQALLNGVGVPGRCGMSTNMKYINVMMKVGTTTIIAKLRWSPASCRRMRPVVAR